MREILAQTSWRTIQTGLGRGLVEVASLLTLPQSLQSCCLVAVEADADASLIHVPKKIPVQQRLLLLLVYLRMMTMTDSALCSKDGLSAHWHSCSSENCC